MILSIRLVLLLLLLFGLKIVVAHTEDDSIYFPDDIQSRIGKGISRQESKENLLPSECGRRHVHTHNIKKRIANGEDAELGEFPWLAALQYVLPSGNIEIQCGGALINDRYVLTAAHCVKVSNMKLHGVRLREYNTATFKDCVDGVCSDVPVIHSIEEEIVHEKYDPHSSSGHNDIALLRLKTRVVPSNYAKPICLPESHSVQSDLIIAGWGLQSIVDKPLDVLQKATIHLRDRDQCVDWYANLRNSRDVTDSEICAGGQDGKDTCKGDSGGPLIQFNYSTDRYEIVGVTSEGDAFCGAQGVPSIYMKVYSFRPWIESKLRP